jgi:hypothetical protein
MTTDERFDRIESALEKALGAVATLAGTVTSHERDIEAHDRQIDGLIRVAERQEASMKQIREAINDTSRIVSDLVKEWQAYIKQRPPQ